MHHVFYFFGMSWRLFGSVFDLFLFLFADQPMKILALYPSQIDPIPPAPKVQRIWLAWAEVTKPGLDSGACENRLQLKDIFAKLNFQARILENALAEDPPNIRGKIGQHKEAFSHKIN